MTPRRAEPPICRSQGSLRRLMVAAGTHPAHATKAFEQLQAGKVLYPAAQGQQKQSPGRVRQNGNLDRPFAVVLGASLSLSPALPASANVGAADTDGALPAEAGAPSRSAFARCTIIATGRPMVDLSGYAACGRRSSSRPRSRAVQFSRHQPIGCRSPAVRLPRVRRLRGRHGNAIIGHTYNAAVAPLPSPQLPGGSTGQ